MLEMPKPSWYILDPADEAFREMYGIVEKDLMDCSQYVALMRRNLRTHSLRFYRLHQEICQYVDAFSKFLLKTYGKWPRGRKPRQITFKHYYPLKSELELGSADVELLNREFRFRPFQSWTQDNPPRWWRDHNKLKHHGVVAHFELATLENVIRSLGALYLLLNHPKASRYNPMAPEVFINKHPPMSWP